MPKVEYHRIRRRFVHIRLPTLVLHRIYTTHACSKVRDRSNHDNGNYGERHGKSDNMTTRWCRKYGCRITRLILTVVSRRRVVLSVWHRQYPNYNPKLCKQTDLLEIDKFITRCEMQRESKLLYERKEWKYAASIPIAYSAGVRDSGSGHQT